MERFEIEGIRDFNLDHIFDCGQCFRWSREADGSYTGIVMGRVVNMAFQPYNGPTAGRQITADPASTAGSAPTAGRQITADPASTAGRQTTAGRLTIENCTADDFQTLWRPYLDLDRDYGAVKEALAMGDEAMDRAIRYGYGIRILRQDLWETIVSFIISQNNNIPRIKGCIETLASQWGRPVGSFRDRTYCSLPEPTVLADCSPEDLAGCKLGYRSRYLVETARAIEDQGGIEVFREKLEEAEQPVQVLMGLSGVGPKVAGCIALFGAGRWDAFPIDVWMRRVMHRLYGIDEKDTRKMEEYANVNFAPYGGLAQQYLFYYIRGLEQARAEGGAEGEPEGPEGV